MKKLFFLLLAGMMILSACAENNSAPTSSDDAAQDAPTLALGSEAKEEEAAPEGLTLTVGNVTGSGAECTIKNDTDTDANFGRNYEIEALSDGVWYELEHTDTAMTMDLLWAPAGGEETLTLSWESSYGVLPAGTYRVKKPVYAGEAPAVLYGEFVIE